MRRAELQIRQDGRVVHGEVQGEVDLTCAPELRAELFAAIPNEAAGLVLDLSGVTYLDSAGLHLIHRLKVDLRHRGQRLRMIIPESSAILDTVRLAGLDWGPEISPSIDEAQRELVA